MKKKNDKTPKKEKIGLLKTARIVVPYIIGTAPALFFISCAVWQNTGFSNPSVSNNCT